VFLHGTFGFVLHKPTPSTCYLEVGIPNLVGHSYRWANWNDPRNDIRAKPNHAPYDYRLPGWNGDGTAASWPILQQATVNLGKINGATRPDGTMLDPAAAYAILLFPFPTKVYLGDVATTSASGKAFAVDPLGNSVTSDQADLFILQFDVSSAAAYRNGIQNLHIYSEPCSTMTRADATTHASMVCNAMVDMCNLNPGNKLVYKAVCNDSTGTDFAWQPMAVPNGGIDCANERMSLVELADCPSTVDTDTFCGPSGSGS
jgi:hypothetical protein